MNQCFSIFINVRCLLLGNSTELIHSSQMYYKYVYYHKFERKILKYRHSNDWQHFKHVRMPVQRVIDK